jgi:hypothetical protein
MDLPTLVSSGFSGRIWLDHLGVRWSQRADSKIHKSDEKSPVAVPVKSTATPHTSVDLYV